MIGVLGWICLVLLCSFGVAVLVGKLIARRHRHQWRIAAAETATGTGRWNKGCPYTIVLRRCATCGLSVTDQMDGYWPFETLTGQATGTVKMKEAET